jgi:hypothetical protein
MKLTFVLYFCLASSSLIAFTHGQELIAKLTANDGAAYDEFGRGVALDGDLTLVAAKQDDDNGRASGSAYVFEIIP